MNKEPDLSISLGPLHLRSPILTASGTAGFGTDLPPEVDLAKLGALVLKTITLEPREGNPPPRVWETPSGLLNAIGLQNPGFDFFVNSLLPGLPHDQVPIIASIGGNTPEEYAALAGQFQNLKQITALELNVSCPNVKAGGIQFGTDTDLLEDLVRRVRKNYEGILIVKLSPNVTEISEVAKAAEHAGADILSLINTLKGMAIDPYSRKPRLSHLTGGLSGPAIRPVAVRMVWEVSRAVAIPVIGMGGIMSGLDAVEFLLAGASAVAVGSSSLVDPSAVCNIYDGLIDYMSKMRFSSLRDVIGAVAT